MPIGPGLGRVEQRRRAAHRTSVNEVCRKLRDDADSLTNIFVGPRVGYRMAMAETGGAGPSKGPRGGGLLSQNCPDRVVGSRVFGDIACTSSDEVENLDVSFAEGGVSDSRAKFVESAGYPGANRRELCRRAGTSAPPRSEWLLPYAAADPPGMQHRSRWPRRHPWSTWLHSCRRAPRIACQDGQISARQVLDEVAQMLA